MVERRWKPSKVNDNGEDEDKGDEENDEEQCDRRQGNLNDKIIYLVVPLRRRIEARPRLENPVRAVSFSMYCKCNQKYRSVLCKLTAPPTPLHPTICTALYGRSPESPCRPLVRFLARFYNIFFIFTFFYFYLCYNLARKWRRNHKITL